MPENTIYIDYKLLDLLKTLNQNNIEGTTEVYRGKSSQGKKSSLRIDLSIYNEKRKTFEYNDKTIMTLPGNYVLEDEEENMWL